MQTSTYTLYNGVEIEVLELYLKDLQGEPLGTMKIGKRHDYEAFLAFVSSTNPAEVAQAKEDDNHFYGYIDTQYKTFAELLATEEGRTLIKAALLAVDALLVDDTETEDAEDVRDIGFVVVDVNAPDLPAGLLQQLQGKETYADTSDLQEHLYSEEVFVDLPVADDYTQCIITGIANKMKKYKAAYFRLIPNPIPEVEA